MKAISDQEDIQCNIDNEENYYPIEGINISGNLATRYKQLYLSDNNKSTITKKETIS